MAQAYHTHTGVHHTHAIRRSRRALPRRRALSQKNVGIVSWNGVWTQIEGSMKTQAQSVKGSLVKRIKANPFIAFGGAMLTGAVIALMLRK